MIATLIARLKPLALFAGLAAVLAAGWLLDPHFLTVANQRDVLGQVSINGVLAVGMTLVIISAGIDLSVGSVMSLCTVVCAMLLMPGAGDSEALDLPSWLGGPLGVARLSRAHLLALTAGGFAAWLISRVARRMQGRPRALLTAAVAAVAAVAVGGAFAASTAQGLSTLAVLAIVPLVGAMMGAINGVIIASTRLQPFIVTLAMMISAVGLAKFVAGQGGKVHAIYAETESLSGAPPSFERLGGTLLTVGTETLRNGRVRPVKLMPVPGLFFAGAWLAAAVLLYKLPNGRYVYAIGGNEETSRLSGVPVERVKLIVYTLSGLLAGLAAVLYAAQYRQGLATAGQMKELDAIAAVVIGGTSLMGGRGGLVGTLIGVMIFGYLSNILQLRAVSSEIQDIVKGVIIVAAAALQTGAGPRAWRWVVDLRRV
jgi:ribose/xylose/arabinose/galactoside ABC-type transport system permease subunit